MHVLQIICLQQACQSQGMRASNRLFQSFWRPTELCKTNCEYSSNSTVYKQKRLIRQVLKVSYHITGQNLGIVT